MQAEETEVWDVLILLSATGECISRWTEYGGKYT